MVHCSVHTPPLSSWDKHPWYPLNRPGGPQSCCVQFVEVTNLLLLPEVRPQFYSCSAFGPVLASCVILTNYLFIEYILFHSPLPHSLGQMFLTLFLSVFYWCKVKFTAWSRYSDSLWAGRSRDWILVGVRFSCPDQLWGQPGLLFDGYRVFPGGKAAQVWCWPPTPSAPRLMKEYCFTFCITNFVFCWATCLSL